MQTREEVGKHKTSTSSEEAMDTSDEMLMEFNISPKFVSGKEWAGAPRPNEGPLKIPEEVTPEDHSAQIIQDAECAKATMFEVLGKQPQSTLATSQIDEDYQMIDTHIEESLKRKIQNFEFVEFSQLLARNRIVR